MNREEAKAELIAAIQSLPLENNNTIFLRGLSLFPMTGNGRYPGDQWSWRLKYETNLNMHNVCWRGRSTYQQRWIDKVENAEGEVNYPDKS